MNFAQWLADFRWAMNVKRARVWRRKLLFSQRLAFDNALQPRIKDDPGMVVLYPDAIYEITIDDLLRAMAASRLRTKGMDYSEHFSNDAMETTARAMNLKPIEFPIDRDRLLRSQEFASRIMTIVGPHCRDKISAYHALVAAAYVAGASIITER